MNTLASIWADYSDAIIWVTVWAIAYPLIFRKPKDKREN